jgi:putative endonuclease
VHRIISPEITEDCHPELVEGRGQWPYALWFDRLTMARALLLYLTNLIAMKQYFVYILLCADKSYYTGITNDLERRLDEHHTGHNESCYTYKRRPLQLVFYEMFTDVNEAIAFEKQVKGWRSAKKEAIISGNWQSLPELAKTAKT